MPTKVCSGSNGTYMNAVLQALDESGNVQEKSYSNKNICNYLGAR